MKSVRETITEALENSQVDHIVTQQSADELIEELLAALEQQYATPQESIDRYYRIAGEVTLAPNFRVLIRQDQEMPFGRWYYQIQCHRADVITGIWGEGFSGKAYLTPHASDNELVQTIFGLYKGYWEHESRESFQWNGRRVFGPHIATQALWDVARRVDIRSAKHEDDTPTKKQQEEQELAALRIKLSTTTKLNLGAVQEALSETSIPADKQTAIMNMLTPKQTFVVGDIVTWLGDGLNITVVKGQVTRIDIDRQKIEVYWSDGSRPIWHRMDQIRKVPKLRNPADVEI